MTFDFRAARLTMVESQVRTADVTDLAITDVMRTAPRETLVPQTKAALAYADAEIEYAPGRYLMRPREAGKLLQAVSPRPLEKALCIAAPYLALVLKGMGLEVIEMAADGAPGGDFDVIVTEGAVAEVPASWISALADGGRMGVVVRSGPVGKARIYVKETGRVAMREGFDATPPYLAGHAPKPQFAL